MMTRGLWIVFCLALTLNSTLSLADTAYTDRLDDIASKRGQPFRAAAHEAALLFKVPEDVFLAVIKDESFFTNMALSDDNGNGSLGVGQINVDEWLAAGLSPEIQNLDIADKFTKENFNTASGGLDPRLNLLTLAHALSDLHFRLGHTPEAIRDGFGNTPAGWLAAAAAFNGDAKIWKTIYDSANTAGPRQISWATLSATNLVELIRTGQGAHKEFWKQEVGNYVAMIATFLFQTGPEFCKLNYQTLEVIKCHVDQTDLLLKLMNRYADRCGDGCF